MNDHSAIYIELSEAMDVSHTFPDGVDLVYAPLGTGREPPPYDDLDPGIRETVRWLYDNGFNPCDSGDGVSKVGNMGCTLDYPHVFMTVRADELAAECDRLAELVREAGIVLHSGPMTPEEAERIGVNFVEPPEGAVFGYIRGNYSPGDPAFIELAGVHDGLLPSR